MTGNIQHTDIFDTDEPSTDKIESSVDLFFDQYEVPAEKQHAISVFILTTRQKNPQMKVDRVLRKVVEYFKLKKKLSK